MIEIELGTEILMAVSGTGASVFVIWCSRRVKRKALEEKAGMQEVSVIVGDTFKPAIVIAQSEKTLAIEFHDDSLKGD